MLFGGFSTNPNNVRESTVNLLKRLAVRLRLIPSTIEGKERLKRVFFGRLEPLPQEVNDAMGNYEPLQTIDPMSPIQNSRFFMRWPESRNEEARSKRCLMNPQHLSS